MASPPFYIDPPLPSWVYLGTAVVMALLGGSFVFAFALRDDGPALGFGLVCLGAAAFAGGAFPSIRRSRLRSAPPAGVTAGSGTPCPVR